MRIVKWQDVAAFAGLPVIFTALGVGAWLTPQEWTVPGTVILIATVWASWVIAFLFFWAKWRAKPTFTLASGIAVWTNGISAITPERVEKAVAFFVMKASGKLGITDTGLREALNALRIEFVDGRVWWGEKAYNGLASGFGVKVNWSAGARREGELPGFKGNAFFHELAHVTQEQVLNKPPDYKHEDLATWDLVAEMKREFTE